MIIYELTLAFIAILSLAYLGSFIDLSFMEKEAFSKDNPVSRSKRDKTSEEDLKNANHRERGKANNSQTRRLWEVTRNLS